MTPLGVITQYSGEEELGSEMAVQGVYVNSWKLQPDYA
jgi:hypothetical protein